MILANTMASIMWLGVTLYTLFGGADFGGGFWDLFAGNSKKGKKQRQLIERSIGPVWETNHVWLIFVLVIMWTCFSKLFGSVTSTLWIPFTLAAFGIIARGAGFAFRKSVKKVWQKRIFGATFATASIVTPFFFGTIAGAVASGNVPLGVGVGDPIHSWLNPVSIMVGALAVIVCAYLAAVYLTADARRSGDQQLVAQFRRRALCSGTVAGAVAAGGIFLFHGHAQTLTRALTHQGLPLIILSAATGLVTMVLLYRNHFAIARLSAALAVTAVVWGWAVAQYPHLLNSGLTITQAAAEPAVLRATLISLGIGAVILVPSLVWLYTLFQQGDTPNNIRGED
jgi:cytochrome d ubiquinol oxidase subunit II